MIRPGLLTASTNKADHLGTSGAGLVACRCIGSVLLSLRGCWSLACKMRFPPSVVEAQHGWALSTAPARSERSGEPEWSLRNGGCGDGLPCEAENEGRGKTKSS